MSAKENPWAIGTKAPTKKQPGKTESTKDISQTQSKHRHIPKLKDRNPNQVLKQCEGLSSEQEISSELTALLPTFNLQTYNIAEFLRDMVTLMDSKGFSNYEVLEYILGQTKTKEYFKDLYKSQSALIIDSLLQSIKVNYSYQNRDSCIRMLGHVCYEPNEIENITIQKMYQSISKIAFDSPLPSGSSGSTTPSNSSSSPAQGSSKTSRLAINCIANILTKQSPFVKQNVESIFMKLKTVFDSLMRKIHNNYKSKRFTQMLTTVIRGLQFSLNENNKINVNDNDAVKLFLNFYKLLFLGTAFAEKMLNIKIEETTKGKKDAKQSNIGSLSIEEEKEQKYDSTSFIIDTSDISTSGAEGLGEDKNSPSSNDSLGSNDPYGKIKTHAALSLQYLFKFNNKALFNYWYLLFPSYLMKSPSEFSQYLYQFTEKKQEYSEKVEQVMCREPTLFYLLRSKHTNSKLKGTICFTISVLLENSHIQKWQGQLEKEDQPMQALTSQSFVSMSSILGQFLRFLHYQLAYMIETEKDKQVQAQLVKISGTLLHITPYSRMGKGLASILMKTLYESLEQPSTCINDTNTKYAIINVFSIGFNLSDLNEELKSTFFTRETHILRFLLLQNPKHDQLHIKESADALGLLQRLAKKFPDQVYEVWEPYMEPYLLKVMKGGDHKKMLSVFKILEEWLRNYKNQSIQNDDQEEGESHIERNPQKDEVQSQQETPFQYQSFVNFLKKIIDKHYSHKEPADVNIALMNILSCLDSTQWGLVFDNSSSTQRALDFTFNIKSPPLFKSNAIKLFGYLVYLDIFNQDQAFIKRLFYYIFDNSHDSNVNIHMRNSWTLANLCCICKTFTDAELIQETLITCINYAVSNKEKILQNAIRALGYLLSHVDLVRLDQEILTSINKNQGVLSRVSNQVFQSWQSQQLSTNDLFKLIIENIDNKSPKIAWNACVAIGNIIDNDKTSRFTLEIADQAIDPLLTTFVERPNFKTRIHAAQTLLKFNSVDAIGGPQKFPKIWESLMNCMENHNHNHGSLNEQKNIVLLDQSLVDLWEQVANMTQLTNEQTDQMSQFLNQNALTLLQIFTDYLRKELKVPLYSALYDEQVLREETANVFKENPSLEGKLAKLKTIFNKVMDLIKTSEKTNVSYGVFEGFSTLAKTAVKEYRGLEVLRVVKSSFEPSFEDSAALK